MKKHTTRTNYDSLQLVEPSVRHKNNEELQNVDDKKQKLKQLQASADEQIEKVGKFPAPICDSIETGSDRMKRNIKDVYYKAVHDAIKYTEKSSVSPPYTGKKT